MTDKAWKAAERRIATLLGGKRVPVNGRSDEPDVAHPWLAVEVKHRASLPPWLLSALGQARKGATADQLPIAVVHQAGQRYEDALVLVRLRDFADWFGASMKEEELA
jgi:hypothetical protein